MGLPRTIALLCLSVDFSAADKFLNTRAVHEALGVPLNLVWQSCSPDVYMNFQGDWLHRFDNLLPDMMADGVRVMIYAGACVCVGGGR
jgi:hypothetical protein